MKLSLITLYVTNIEKSLEFYNGLLKMPILSRQVVEGNKEMIFLGYTEDFQLEFIEVEKETVYSGFSIGYEVENLDEVRNTIVKAGYPVINEFSPSENIKLCFLEGPSGETVELIEYK